MISHKWPGGLAPAPAFERFSKTNPTVCSSRRQPFCPLHGVCLVHRLPTRCPMATANPLATIEALQRIAWKAIGNPHSSEKAEALEALDQADTCTACMDRILASPVVRRLRARAGRAA